MSPTLSPLVFRDKGLADLLHLRSYGSDQFALNSFLQNRRFDQAMVAFLDCLRQLIEWVMHRDGGAAGGVRVPHL